MVSETRFDVDTSFAAGCCERYQRPDSRQDATMAQRTLYRGVDLVVAMIEA
jgi:hypothetical protein